MGYDYVVAGAGPFGAVFAHEARRQGKSVLVVERRNHIGGNVYCENKDGITIHVYGAHIFHTSMKHVWDYVNRFASFNHYINSPIANYKGKIYNLPFNMNTFSRMWGIRTPEEAKAIITRQRQCIKGEPKNLEEQAISLVGTDIYEQLIKGYTEKQWGRPATELPAFIIKRLPFRFVYDNNYFNDEYQGIPKGGYNKLIESLFEGADVRLGTNYFSAREELDSLVDKVLFTGCIDEYYDFRFGHLEYRSLRFEHERLEMENYQGNAVINYCEREIPYTRVIEHKHFEFGKQPHTVITREYPSAFTPGDEPYYPVNDERNMRLYEKYKELAIHTPGVLFGGRLAQYAYFDMDDTVAAALVLAQNEL